MTNLKQPCDCISAQNICCSGSTKGISLIQPRQQLLPDGKTAVNPAFIADTGKSFWTYRFLIGCTKCTESIISFVIPICEYVSEDQLAVSEQIDGGEFHAVSFVLTGGDCAFGPAPKGFQYIKVYVKNRYKTGACVTYRIELSGHYPVKSRPVKVKTKNCIITFGCRRCFLVPGCHPDKKLSVAKKCSASIADNQATLDYMIEVRNIGSKPLENVLFKDILLIPVQLTPGQITVTPSFLNVASSGDGKITISGNLEMLPVKSSQIITYRIKIAAVSSPGTYTVTNTAYASSGIAADFASCFAIIKAVALNAGKYCRTEGEITDYTLLVYNEGSSPDVSVDLFDHLAVPPGVTIKLLSFSGCEGYFSGTSVPVPANVPISGPADIDFICRNVLVQKETGIIKAGSYQLIESSAIGTHSVVNTFTRLVPSSPDEQIILGISNVPVSASADVKLQQFCRKPCF